MDLGGSASHQSHPSRGAAAKAALKCYLSAAPIQLGGWGKYKRGGCIATHQLTPVHNCHVNMCRCLCQNKARPSSQMISLLSLPSDLCSWKKIALHATLPVIDFGLLPLVGERAVFSCRPSHCSPLNKATKCFSVDVGLRLSIPLKMDSCSACLLIQHRHRDISTICHFWNYLES
ncbi:hypothetical protein AMECASPLE_023769 [Ameca splendens]|uniref:Uncharacterized protein n=1 Tax=Ameca splendens TaxID=208324 RepID=A0ABV1A0B2_9TELE